MGMKRVIYVCVSIFLASQVAAQSHPASLSVESNAPGNALSEAFRAKAGGDWGTALGLASTAGPAAFDVIEWQRLRASQGTLEDTLSFISRRPDWPGLPLLRKRSEKTITEQDDPVKVIAFFAGQTPRTLYGSMRLAQALARQGKSDLADQEIQRGWVSFPGTEAVEDKYLSNFKRQVSPYHQDRLDTMLWDGHTNAASRMIPRVSGDAAALAQARLALQTQSDGGDAAFENMPVAMANDPGLALDRFKWRAAKGRWNDANEILTQRSTSTASLGIPEKWASNRMRIARDQLHDGNYVQAYRTASNHFLGGGANFAELEWLAGFLALRKLNRADVALFHFQRHQGSVTSPISLARTHYWQGRAYEALGRGEAAQAAYRNGAKFQTAFYGLLSAEKARVPMDPKLVGTESFGGGFDARFTGSSVYKAAQVLLDAGQPRIGVRFLTHLAEGLSRHEIGQMTEVARAAGLPQVELLLAKRGVQHVALIEGAYYPLHPLTDDVQGIPKEMALSIVRRESEFFPDARSGVGALGLMQLMPPTAREVAVKLGLGFEQSRLISDPSYNARLGGEYLRQLYTDFGNSPVQIAAAYNAGPSRPIRWMKERGDPRQGQVDVIDWIEEIPFNETRNYVMRVTEALPIYRARLSGQPQPLEFTKLLKGNYVAPQPPPKPVAPASSIRPQLRPIFPATE